MSSTTRTRAQGRRGCGPTVTSDADQQQQVCCCDQQPQILISRERSISNQALNRNDRHHTTPHHTTSQKAPRRRRQAPSKRLAQAVAEDEDEAVAEGAQAASPLPLLWLLNAVPGAVASLLSGDVGHGVVPLPEPAAAATDKGKGKVRKGSKQQVGLVAWWRSLPLPDQVWARHQGWAGGLLRWAGVVALGGVILCMLAAGAYCLRPMCGGFHPTCRARQLVAVRGERMSCMLCDSHHQPNDAPCLSFNPQPIVAADGRGADPVLHAGGFRLRRTGARGLALHAAQGVRER
jgi:hypothetical protein